MSCILSDVQQFVLDGIETSVYIYSIPLQFFIASRHGRPGKKVESHYCTPNVKSIWAINENTKLLLF